MSMRGEGVHGKYTGSQQNKPCLFGSLKLHKSGNTLEDYGVNVFSNTGILWEEFFFPSSTNKTTMEIRAGD